MRNLARRASTAQRASTRKKKQPEKKPMRRAADALDPRAFGRAWVRKMELEKELLAVGPPLVLGRSLLRGLSGHTRWFDSSGGLDVTHEITWGISQAFRTMAGELRLIREAAVAMRNKENDVKDKDPVAAICGIEARCYLLADLVPDILRANGMMTAEYKSEAAE